MSDDRPTDEPPDLKVVQGGKRGKTASRRGFITLSIYENLAALYVVQGIRTMRRLSKESGVSQDTCAKAITTGWPERGWPPLRQRAAEHDSAQQKANPKPIGEQVVVEAMQFQKIRHDNLLAAVALRTLIRQMANMVYNELPNATLYRQGIQVRVIDEVRGKRIVQRVVKENVRLPPYLPDMARVIADAAQIIKTAGDHERQWSRYEPPEEGGSAGWDALTDSQLKEFVESKGEKLPEGFTLEQLRRKT